MESYDDDLKNFEAHGAESLPVASNQGYVDHDGARSWYATYGSGSPVILLHGGLGHRRRLSGTRLWTCLRRTRRNADTIRGAAPGVTIGPPAALRAGARPERVPISANLTNGDLQRRRRLGLQPFKLALSN
jgi:hypothetical protein